MLGNQVTEQGYYWVRRNPYHIWSVLRVEVPERCHAECGLGNWEFKQIHPPKEIEA